MITPARLHRTSRQRRRSILLAALFAGLSVLSAACSIGEDSEPRNIPEDRIVGFGAGATGDAATGASRIYLLTPPTDDGQRRLRAVSRVAETGGPDELLQSLFSGPNADEVERSLGTALPTDIVLISARTVGTRLTIDINNSLAELSDEGVRFALAQIVATASEIDGIERVRIRVEGANQAWPTGDGRLVIEALSIYDYPGFLESSQPPFTALPS